MTTRAMTRIAPSAALTIAAAVGLLAISVAALAAKPDQSSFPTPQDAAAALAAAARAGDTAAMVAILGPKSEALVVSGDAVADAAMRKRFVDSYDEAHEIVPGPDDTRIVQTGKDSWQLPIPLVDTADGWRFDAEAGNDELVARRIGANELATIQTCLAYVDAQREYYERNPEGSPLRHHAQRIASTAGKRDGLYWPAAAGEPESPLGELFAKARGEGYSPGDEPIPYHGYFYRILTRQGASAPGGAYDYLVRGEMVGGFALIATPARYGSSGVMTLLVNHDGDVYDKDLGPDTVKIASSIRTYDPDATWRKVREDALATPSGPRPAP